MEDIMLASFLPGMHGQVEDSLKVWEVKEALEYVTACLKAGDFDNLEQYYNKTPWWV